MKNTEIDKSDLHVKPVNLVTILVYPSISVVTEKF